MKLHTLSRSKGLHKKAIRVGRGNASGKGNYSGKGHKGQKARSGVKIRPFFEGGQTSIIQRMPKHRGFKRYYKLQKDIVILNVAELERNANIVDLVDKELLVKEKYLPSVQHSVKILGQGELSKALKIVGIEKISESAKVKIEKAGGTIA